MTFISVHIPKTAGTSLAFAFDHGTDRAILYDYRADYSNKVFTEAEAERFVRAKDFILGQFAFIHGHFYLQKYTEVLPEAKTTACFRHPVDRIISQFKHIYYEANIESEYYKAFSGGMDVVEFTEADDNVARAHIVHLGGIPPRELDFIFLSEAVGEGLELFQKRYPKVLLNGWATAPMINAGSTREKSAPVQDGRKTLEITQAHRSAIAAKIPEELAYFEEARAAYAEKKKTILNL
ncbi:MAG: hypothetical protein AcusKO_40510 [Acuticoccus sp.]